MRWSWVIAMAIGAAGGVGAQTPELPRPAEIEPDVQFWVRVYTEVDTRSGFIHDSKNLRAVYRTVRFAEGITGRERRRQLNAAYDSIREVLGVLAEGKRENLTEEEQRFLSFWPENVSNAELRASADRLRFQLGQSNRFRAGLIRSGAWRGYIEEVLRERGLPLELAALPHVESSFDPTAYSKVGAAGMWQFTRSTGLRYMRIDHIVDERRDPFIATVAASRLLENNYDVLESWPLAITAYNHGQAGMRRAKRVLGTDDISTILRNYEGRTFGFASRNFYVAFLAAVQVDASFEDYFGPLEINEPIETMLVEVPDYLTVATLQSALNTDRGSLRHWNPALTDAVWGGDKFVPRGFELRLPASTYGGSVAQLASIPDTQRYAAQMPDVMHRIRSGETLSGIADRYGVSMSSLVNLNGLRSRNFIRAGQVLRLPGSDGGVPLTLAQLNGEEPGETYVVRAGDTIDIIARRFGISEDEVLARNGIQNRNLIYVGQILRLAPGDDVVEPEAEVVLANVEQPAEVVVMPAILKRTPEVAEPAVVVRTEPEPDEPLLPGPYEFQPAERIPAPPIVLSDAGEPLVDAETVAAMIDEEEADEDEFSAEENVLASAQAELAADPSDYYVSADGTIEVQALETLGHYADWLGIRTQRLRDINGIPFDQAVVIGQRLELTFDAVDRAAFEQRRVEFQRSNQEAFFLAFQITNTHDHVVRSGESLWVLAQRTYRVPVWLLRQFNPDLDLDRVTPGTVVKFPELQPIAAVDSGTQASAANNAPAPEAI